MVRRAPRRRGAAAAPGVAELALCTCALPLLRLLLLAVHCDAAVDGGGAGGRLPMATEGECWSSWGRAASAAAAALVLLPWVRAVLHHAMLNARLGVGVGWRFGWAWLQAKLLLAAAATWPRWRGHDAVRAAAGDRRRPPRRRARRRRLRCLRPTARSPASCSSASLAVSLAPLPDRRPSAPPRRRRRRRRAGCLLLLRHDARTKPRRRFARRRRTEAPTEDRSR